MDSTAILSIILTALLALIGGIVLERYKKRTIILERFVTIQPIAFEANNDNWGLIEVYFNGSQSQNLYRGTVELVNNSSQSISNIDVSISVDEGYYIYRQQGYLIQDEVSIGLFLTDNFNSRRQFVNDHQHDDPKPNLYNDELKYVVRHRQFSVPVLNQKSKIWIELLIDGGPNLHDINLAVLKPNVRLVNKRDADVTKKKDKSILNILASFIYIVCVFPIISYSQSKTSVGWLMVLNSLTCYLGAWVLLYLYNLINKYFAR